MSFGTVNVTAPVVANRSVPSFESGRDHQPLPLQYSQESAGFEAVSPSWCLHIPMTPSMRNEMLPFTAGKGGGAVHRRLSATTVGQRPGPMTPYAVARCGDGWKEKKYTFA